MNGQRVKLMQLREYVSDRTGATYFSGFLGNAKVVVLRDDRAEITGREKARWTVLLEEQEPRDGSSPAARSPRRSRAERQGAAASAPRETVADRHAGEFLHDQGIDPASDMPRDEVPF